MKKAQAEANWGWSAEHGSLRPPQWPKYRRFRCTEKNVMDQQRLADNGTLIHTMAVTDCPRKASGVDRTVESYDEGKGTIIYTGTASFIENVNCLWCRRDYFKKR